MLACPETHHFAVSECSKNVSRGAEALWVVPSVGESVCARAGAVTATSQINTPIVRTSRGRHAPKVAACKLRRIGQVCLTCLVSYFLAAVPESPCARRNRFSLTRHCYGLVTVNADAGLAFFPRLSRLHLNHFYSILG